LSIPIVARCCAAARARSVCFYAFHGADRIVSANMRHCRDSENGRLKADSERLRTSLREGSNSAL
jgi:hypothetical protein